MLVSILSASLLLVDLNSSLVHRHGPGNSQCGAKYNILVIVKHGEQKFMLLIEEITTSLIADNKIFPVLAWSKFIDRWIKGKILIYFNRSGYMYIAHLQLADHGPSLEDSRQ